MRKVKKNYFANIDTKSIIDNKKFWKTLKPMFSDKNISADKINLAENDLLMSSNTEVSETFNNYFINIVNNLNIPKNVNSKSPDLDPIIKATQKYQKHPSIIAIKSSFQEHHKKLFRKLVMKQSN